MAGNGVFVLGVFKWTHVGVANKFDRKLPEEDENRYRALEAKRSAALARGEQLSPAEEAEWQALEDRKFPVGRDGGGKRRDETKSQPPKNRNVKVLSDQALEETGLDAHQIKKDFLGKKAKVSLYDLHKDTNTDEVLIFRKGGMGEPIHTDSYI